MGCTCGDLFLCPEPRITLTQQLCSAVWEQEPSGWTAPRPSASVLGTGSLFPTLSFNPVLFLVPHAHLHSHTIQTKLFPSQASREPISGDFKALLALLVPKTHHHVELNRANMGTNAPLGGVWDPAMLCINK